MQGIYFIKNTQNDRVYVGQTVDFEVRKFQHLSSLRTGKHKNRWLQADYNDVGISVFDFGMLEEIEDLDTLAEREDYWINQQETPYNKNLYRPKSKMKQMSTILRRIHQRGLDQVKGV